MRHRKLGISPFAALVLASVLGLAGCGGGGAGSDAITSRLNVIAGANFNGSTSSLETGNASTVVQNGHTIATVSSGGRTLRLDIPVAEIHAGDTFDVGADGTTAVYTEVRSRDSQTYTWIGSSGRITINATTDGVHADIDVTGVNFVADVQIEANPAQGSFTLAGNVNGIPISGGGGIGGQASLTFSNPQGTNADLSSFSVATIAYAQVQGNGTLAATTGTGESRRVLNVVLTQNAEVGDVVDLSDALNGKAQVTFGQGTTQNPRLWTAHAGTVKIVGRTATTAKVQFTNVVFNSTSGEATGSFTLNGILARR
jgi:hypothetical protein